MPQAFHVVAPSLPGYGFSSAPTQPGFGIRAIAATVNELMLKLGYGRYVAQGAGTLPCMLQPAVEIGHAGWLTVPHRSGCGMLKPSTLKTCMQGSDWGGCNVVGDTYAL